jgi:hypothetical protein
MRLRRAPQLLHEITFLVGAFRGGDEGERIRSVRTGYQNVHDPEVRARKSFPPFERWILVKAYQEILKAGTDQPTKTKQDGTKVHLLRIDVVRDYFRLPVREKSRWHRTRKYGDRRVGFRS